MFRSKIVGFISKIDQFINEFNRTHTKSPAQAAEIQKYKKIHEMRDNPNYEKQEEII